MVCRPWPVLSACVALLSVMPLMAACDKSGREAPTDPIAVEVNQSRDQYGKEAILIQLTNTSDTPLTVTAARLDSALFDGEIVWTPANGSLELPPRQPKSVPVPLPPAACEPAPSGPIAAAVQYSAPPDQNSREAKVEATDPFGVLTRNSDELCLASEAAAIASVVLDPGLEVAPDGSTAVVRLVITPAATSAGSPQSLTIESIDGTTLLAEVPADPWPRNLTVPSGAVQQEVALRIRPARCDPHAVAEDKVGTLLPLRIQVGERHGLLKIAAPNDLRGRIYDFVTAACGGQ
ncbi:hypothetical protein ACIQC5_15540 [Paenarthrobacter sp. NPDC092416]|uniref:hypothetical protein n=1 Tax=Paenarthrobacter sp. NPDC092416 TaxID=3364386 RepID=UPI0038273F80